MCVCVCVCVCACVRAWYCSVNMSKCRCKLSCMFHLHMQQFLCTSVGDLCIYEEEIPTSGDIISNCSTEFKDYFRTLREKTPCDELTPGVLEWTPNEDTPDLLYYQVTED